MAMTKKDYEAVASMINAVRADWATSLHRGRGDVDTAMRQLVSALSGVFAAGNERFDRERFAKAAGGGL
jgi:hypothetical protein